MEFPEDRYYKVNRILLSITGLWPYDNIKVRQLQFMLLLLILISFISAQMLKLFTSEFKLNTLLKVLSFNIFIIIMTIKYITFYIIADNVKIIRKYLLDNWSSLMNDQEIDIIYKQLKAGKILTIFIITFAYFLGFFWILSQYIPSLLDIIMPLNVSRPYQYLVEIEYLVDQQKYFHIIAMNLNIGLLTFGTTALATEMYILTNAFHAFGLFKIASYRMKNILSGNHLQTCATKKYIASRDRITAAVDMHRRAIQYSELLKNSFGAMYLLLFIGVIFSMSINLFYLLRIITTGKNIPEIILHILIITLHLIGMIAGNYVGQQFINCDTHVYRTICNTQWYNAPLKTQKLILFLIQKTTQCYKVDACGMFSPSLEGLATSLSMSASYFMVFCSI